MNLTANADFSNLVTSVNRVSASLLKMQEQIGASNRILTGQIAATNKAFSDTLRQTGQFGTHFVTLTDDVAKFGGNLDKGQLKLRDYYGAWQQHARTSGGLIRQLAQQQVQLQNAILQPLGKNAQGLMQFNVQVPKGLDVIKNKTAIASQELKIMNKVMQQGADGLINWGKNTQWAGRQLTVGLTVPIAAFGLAASKAFREADQELVRLTKVYGGVAATSAVELGKVRREVSATAQTLAKEFGASYKETIGLAADLAATGKQGDDLLKATSETTRLMILGEVDRQDAMKATLTIQNTFNQNTKELAESVNFLNAVENQTSLTIQDLTEAIPKAGPVIKALGGDVKDVALYLTAMKEGGIGAAEGANALKSAFASMINPTKVATAQFKSFGIDLPGMVKKNTGDTTQMLLDLQGALDKLDPLSKSRAIEQLFGKFQFARMTALIDNLGKQGSQSLQVLDLLKQSTSDIASIADRELKAVTESASGKYRRAVEGLKADLAGIGDEFLKIQTFFINVTDKIVKFVNMLPGPIKSILVFLAGLTAVAGPLIMLTGVMANFIGYIIKGAFHFKALFKSGEGWRMLTPEILAAQRAGTLIEKTFYSDAKAALSLAEALQVLEGGYGRLQAKMNAGAVPVNPTITNLAGSVMIPGAGAIQRTVDPTNPLVGNEGTRASAHINPLRGRTQQQIDGSTIFGFIPGPIPVNNALKDTPQMYADGDLPNIPGLTTASSKHGPVSTGIVAAEASKFQTLMGTMSMMTKTEVAAMKKQIQTTGTVNDEFMTAYSALLPQITNISQSAVAKSAAIVSQVKSGELGLAQARERLIQLNYEIESAMGIATTGVATSLGRTANLTAVPGIDQPVVDSKGKSNMRQMFGKGNATFMDKLAGIFGVKTYGASYSTHTTRPKRLNAGGRVYDPSTDGNVVPGDTSINYDNTPARLQAGGFILNQAASRNNPDLVNLARNARNAGGPIVPALLTPGETYFPPSIAKQIMPILEEANGGGRTSMYALGGLVSPTKTNYGLLGFQNKLKFGANKKMLEKIVPGFKPNKSATDKDVWYLKPFTGLFAKDSGNINELMASGGPGAPVGNFIKALKNYAKATKGLLGGKRSVYGSTDGFLSQVPNGLLPLAERKAIALKIEQAYLAKLSEMEMAGKLITDENNPYHKISNKIMMDYVKSSGNKTLGKLWKQFRVATSSVDKYQGTGRGPSTNPKGVDISADGFSMSVGKHEGDRSLDVDFLHAVNSDWQKAVGKNAGGMIGGTVRPGKYNYGLKLPDSVIAKLTAKWPGKKQFYPNGYQYMLGNQDPLHGPLQIGMSNNLNRFSGANDLSRRQEVVFKDDRFSRLNIMPAFLTGTAENRGRYATSQYMSGNLDIMSQMERLGNHPLGPIAAMKTLQKKFTGKLYRGLILGKTHNSLPEKLIEDIRMARATGDYSNLIGQEFIMRRSSWSKNKIVGSAFAPGHGVNVDSILLEASVRNRNILPAGDMFPEKVFQAPYGQSWNKTRFGSGAMSEQEAIFGGKFKIVGFDNGKMQVETVVDAARENGGPVNSGRPYLVGEKGPEVFVPRNSGGIIPNYALGGVVRSGKTGYGKENPMGGAGGFIAKNLAANIAFMMLPQLLSKIGAPRAVTDNIYPAMMAGQIAFGARRMLKNQKAQQGAGEVAEGAIKAEGALGKLSPRFVQLAGVASKAAGPIGVVVAGLQIYQMLENNRKKNEEIYSVSFGLTAKTAKEAGIQVKKLDEQLKASSDAAKSTSSKAALLFSQDSAGIQGLSLTNKELKDLEQSVKKTMPTYVEAFKRMSGNEIVTGATRIKAQWVAMGMSVEEANKKIYALVKTTHGADSALKAITSNSYKGITDKATAAKEAITLVGVALKNVNKTGASGAAASLDTFFQIQTARLEKLKAEALKSDKTKDMPAESSYIKLMKEYSNSGANNIKITREVISELAKTQPVLASILNATDTIGSSMSKWIIATSGTIPNLERIASLTAAQANTVAKGIVAVQDASNVALSSDKAVAAKQKALADAKARLINAEKASAGISVKDQVGTKNRIKALEAEIKKIEEAAAARKKAMQEQQTNSDVLLQIQRKQLDYQQALASGDSAAAAQAQLDIQQISGSRQTQMAMNAIDTNTTNLTGPLKDEIARLSDSLQKSADAAAIAADSASSIAKTIASLSEKEAALKTSLQKALNDKLLYGVDSKAFAADIKVMFNDYVNLLGLKPDKNGVYKNSDGKVITPEGIYAALEKNALKELSINGQNVYVIAAGKLLTGKDLTGSGDGVSKLPPKQQAAIKKEEKKPYDQRDPNVPVGPAKGSGGAMRNPKYKSNQNLGPVTGGMPRSNISGDYLYAGNGLVYLKDDPSQMVGQWYSITSAGRIAYASGGLISGPGTSTSDSILAQYKNGGMLRVSNKEYITRAASVADIGVANMDLINKYGKNGLAAAASNMRFDVPRLGNNSNTGYNMNSGGSVIYLTQNITAADGTDTELLSMRIVDMAKKAISADVKVSSSKMGGTKEFGSRVMNT